MDALHAARAGAAREGVRGRSRSRGWTSGTSRGPGVRRFSFRQRVRALSEAAIYKTDVEFRWYDAEGQLLRQTLERSRRCRQPGALPNLHVQRIGRRPSGQYFVRVGNDGRDMAAGASVQLFVDGHDAGTVELPDIAARGGRRRAVQRTRLRGLGPGGGRPHGQRARVRRRTTTRARCPAPSSVRRPREQAGRASMDRVSRPVAEGTREAAQDLPVGGQAVLEGVMMRGVSTWAVAVRKPTPEQLGDRRARPEEGRARGDRGRLGAARLDRQAPPLCCAGR